jgi:hypothetical protein
LVTGPSFALLVSLVLAQAAEAQDIAFLLEEPLDYAKFLSCRMDGTVVVYKGGLRTSMGRLASQNEQAFTVLDSTDRTPWTRGRESNQAAVSPARHVLYVYRSPDLAITVAALERPRGVTVEYNGMTKVSPSLSAAGRPRDVVWLDNDSALMDFGCAWHVVDFSGPEATVSRPLGFGPRRRRRIRENGIGRPEVRRAHSRYAGKEAWW